MTSGSGSKVISISSVMPTRSRISLLPTATMTSLPTVTHKPKMVTSKTHFRQLENVTGKERLDFKRLASLLQRMIDKRKVKKSHTTKESETKQNLKNNSQSGEAIRSSLQQNTLSVSDLRPTELLYHRLNFDWRAKNSHPISRYAC
uniref:SWIB domain-containing protein n=1 Tax=Elaeophora elaphi TaxID=1147741 RepID=A0A0R3RKW5_9BILA